MADFKLSAVLELKDRFTAGVRRGMEGLKNLKTGCMDAAKGSGAVQAGADKAAKSAEDLGKKAQGASKGIGALKSGLSGVVGGLVGMGAAAAGINMFKQFDDTMLAVKAKTKATGEEFTALREKAKELGATTRFSASEAAKGMDYLAMAGYKTNDIIDAMPGLLNLAEASGEDLASVSDIVSDAMTAFGWAAKDTEKFADIMAYASTSSNTNVGMMGEAFKYVASMSRTAGVSAQETATALGMMANAGVKGSMAGTALRSSLIRLMKPPKEAADAMAGLGISAIDNQGKFVGLRSTIAQFTEKTKNMTKAQKSSAAAAIFGTEAVSGMMGMINQGPEAFDKFLEGVQNSKGASAEMAAVMNSGIGGAIDSMLSALEGVVINLGDKLAPAISGAAGVVAGFATYVNGCDFSGFVAGIGGLTAAFFTFRAATAVQTAGGILAWLAPAKVALLALSGPALVGAAAVGAIVAAGIWLASNWSELEKKSGVWGVIGGDIKAVVGAIANEVEYVIGVVDNELTYLGNLFGNELAYIGGIVANEFLYARGVIINEFKYMSDVIKNEVAYWSGVIKNETQYIKDKFADAVKYMSDQIDGIKQFLKDHEDAIKTTAEILTTIFAPALIKSGTEAAIAGGKIATRFVAGLISTGREAVINGAKVTGSFIASMIQTGTTAVITGAKTTASFVASLVKAGVEAVITSGKITGSLLVSMGQYVISGWRVLGSIAMQTGAWAAQRLIILGTALAQGVLTVATGIWSGVCAIASGVTWALGAAFAFLTSPIGLVVLAIAGVVAVGIWMYKHWDEIKAWLILLWNDPLKAIDQFVEGAKKIFTGIFDWLDEKWQGIKKLFSTPITANVRKGAVSGVEGAVDEHRAVGTNYFTGGLTEINERGGEIVDLPRGSRIYPAATTQRIIERELGSAGWTPASNISISGNTFVVREEADIKRIAEELVRMAEVASLNFGGA